MVRGIFLVHAQEICPGLIGGHANAESEKKSRARPRARKREAAMNRTFFDAVETRRSCYALSGESPVSDADIRRIIERAVMHAPSAFNSQSSRLVLLKGDEHAALWKIAMDALRAIVPADAFAATEAKITSFAAAYATILYFEDQDTVKGLQEKFPSYAHNFPVWSNQHSGILQFIIWTALADAGLGASLQHYNELIEDAVKKRWDLPQNWKLIAQMPFGTVCDAPGDKDFLPMETRLRVLG